MKKTNFQDLTMQEIESIMGSIVSLMEHPAWALLYEYTRKSGKSELNRQDVKQEVPNAQEIPLVKPESHNEDDLNNRTEPVMLIEDVAALFRVKERTIHAWLREARQGIGDFPQPISGSKKRLRWLSSVIEKHLRRKNKK